MTYGVGHDHLGTYLALEQLRMQRLLITKGIIRCVCTALHKGTPLSLSSDDEIYLIDAKEDLLEALLKLNLDVKLRIFAQICEQAESPLGKIFWAQRELTATSLAKGTLYHVSQELEKCKLINIARQAAIDPVTTAWSPSKAQIKILVHSKEDLLVALLELEPLVKQRVLLQALDKNTVLGSIFWARRKLTAPGLGHGTLSEIAEKIKALGLGFVMPVSRPQSGFFGRLFTVRSRRLDVSEAIEMNPLTHCK